MSEGKDRQTNAELEEGRGERSRRGGKRRGRTTCDAESCASGHTLVRSSTTHQRWHLQNRSVSQSAPSEGERDSPSPLPTDRLTERSTTLSNPNRTHARHHPNSGPLYANQRRHQSRGKLVREANETENGDGDVGVGKGYCHVAQLDENGLEDACRVRWGGHCAEVQPLLGAEVSSFLAFFLPRPTEEELTSKVIMNPTQCVRSPTMRFRKRIP